MKLYETLEKTLKKESNFVTDNGEIKKWVIITKAQNHDAELISLLLDNEDLKEEFFIKVKEVRVQPGIVCSVYGTKELLE